MAQIEAGTGQTLAQGPAAEGPAAGGRIDAVNELKALYQLTDRLYRARSQSEVYGAALDAILDTLSCDRASVLLFDDAGVMQFVAWRGLSDHYRTALRGHSPWKPGDSDPQPIFVSDIDDTDEPDWIKQTIRDEGIRALGFIPLVADGFVVGKFMTYYAKPRVFVASEIDIAVTIARQVGFSLERARADARRRAAELDLRESEARFRLMSENAPCMIWMSDAQGKCLHLNRRLREFWGVTEEGIADFSWEQTTHPDDIALVGAEMVAAITERRPCSIIGRFRSVLGDGYRVLQTDAQPRLSPSGEFLGMIGVNIDISERQRADAQRELLLAELNHRVKNTLAVVQAMAHQTFRSAGVAKEPRQAFEKRLLALAAAHNLLTDSSWESAALSDIARATLQADTANNGRVEIEGPRVLLPPREALAVAMALHELATNAVKYGALSNDKGRVRLQWTREPGRLVLSWTEMDGPTVDKPERRGFGSVLLERSLHEDLGGTVALDYRREGVTCMIELPWRDRV